MSPAVASEPGSTASTAPPRGRADGFTTNGPGSSRLREKVFRARSAIPSAIARDSANLWRTAFTTSSTEQAQIESCAEFLTTPSHARSRNRAGHDSAGAKSAA